MLRFRSFHTVWGEHVINRGDLELLRGGKDGEVPIVLSKVQLQSAWQRRQEAEHTLAYADMIYDGEHSPRAASTLRKARQAFKKTHVNYAEAACNLADIPASLRCNISTRITDSAGTVDIRYGDLNPKSFDNCECTVYWDGSVLHSHRPGPEIETEVTPSPRKLLKLVR